MRDKADTKYNTNCTATTMQRLRSVVTGSEKQVAVGGVYVYRS